MALYTLHLFVQFDEWGLERSSHSRPRGGTILFTFAGFARHSAWPASLGGHARPNACPLFSDQFFLLLLVFSSNEMFGLASFLPPLFFTSPVCLLLEQSRAHTWRLPFQKPACILSALLIHHCHCFYLRKTTDGRTAPDP